MTSRSFILLTAVCCSVCLAGCGAPKPPMPSGERIPVNADFASKTEERTSLADERPSFDPFESGKPQSSPSPADKPNADQAAGNPVVSPVVLEALPVTEEPVVLQPEASAVQVEPVKQ